MHFSLIFKVAMSVYCKISIDVQNISILIHKMSPDLCCWERKAESEIFKSSRFGSVFCIVYILIYFDGFISKTHVGC